MKEIKKHLLYYSSIVKIVMLALCLKVAVPLQFRKVCNRLRAGQCVGENGSLYARGLLGFTECSVCFDRLCLSLGLVAYVPFVMARGVSKAANSS